MWDEENIIQSLDKLCDLSLDNVGQDNETLRVQQTLHRTISTLIVFLHVFPFSQVNELSSKFSNQAVVIFGV